MAAKRNPFEPPVSNFYKHHTIEELIAQQGAVPVNLDEIRAEFSDLWPDDASIEAFQTFIEEIRAPKATG